MAVADITTPTRWVKDPVSRNTPVAMAFQQLLQAFGCYLQSEHVEGAVLRHLSTHAPHLIDDDPFGALLAQTRQVLLLEDHRAEDTQLRAMAFLLQSVLSLEDDGE